MRSRAFSVAAPLRLLPLALAGAMAAGRTAQPGETVGRAGVATGESPPEVGRRITLGIDTARLLLFDPQGNRLGGDAAR